MHTIRPPFPLRLSLVLLVASLGSVGCAQKDAFTIEEKKYFDGDMPVDFSGSWARDYARGDDVYKVWEKSWFEVAKQRGRNGPAGPYASDRDMSMLRPLAQLAELITRPDELTISQSEYEILVERKDDFALMCAFFDGVAKPTNSDFAREICGWDGKQLISYTSFTDGLTIVHQFDVSEDRKHLRIITTLSSDRAPIPFTLEHYYVRFDKYPGMYECIETLSMKRVCSTGGLTP